MNVVIRVNEEIKQKMIEYYKDKVRDKKIPYVVFQAQEEDTVITMYESGKVMFQGTSADVDASMWGVALEKSKDKEKPKIDEKYHNCSSVGSDEVGTGDYFGPIVVTASYVTKDDVSFLDELGVGDSKKINDEKIKKIAPEIAKRVKYRSVILSNKEYNEKYTKDEVSSMAFSELYGKAQAIIRTLSSCSVGGKILTSKELVDLLYVAYNRDEAERFGIDKAMLAGYDELYSTSQDVFEKKIKVLDEEIKDKAIDLANETIMKVKSRPQKIADDKQSKFEELVKKMAEVVITDNKEYLGQDVAESAIEELENMIEEGGKEENEKEKRTTRTRKTNK